MLDNPPQPEAADMREEGDGAPIPPAPAVGEGASQPLDGEAASHSAKGDDEDQVPLSERYKRSRSSTPIAADESSSPGVAGEALGAPAVVPRPSRDGRKRLKIGLALRPMAAGARLVFATLLRFFSDCFPCFDLSLISETGLLRLPHLVWVLWHLFLRRLLQDLTLNVCRLLCRLHRSRVRVPSLRAALLLRLLQVLLLCLLLHMLWQSVLWIKRGFRWRIKQPTLTV